MDNILKKINEYFLMGYSINEIIECMQPEIDSEFKGNVDKFYLLVERRFNALRTNMTKEEYEKIKLLRKERAEAKKIAEYKRIATKVKEKTEELQDNYSSLKEALGVAVQLVANFESLSTELVRNYTRIIYPEFYEYYFNNRNITEEDLVAMAQRIIDNNMYASTACKLNDYNKMMEYISVHRPDLYEQIKAVYASHVNTEEFRNRLFQNSESVFFNYEYLEKIIWEFRPSLNLLLYFLNRNLLFTKRKIDSEEELMNLLYAEPNTGFFNTMRWYLSETVVKDDYKEYRNKRFEEFCRKFFSIKNIEARLNFVNQVTAIDLNSVKEKINQHHQGENYFFTLDDNRQIVRFCYNYALTRKDLESALFSQRVEKTYFIDALAKSPDIYDQMLVDGAKRLNEYYKDIEVHRRSGSGGRN